MQTCTNIVYLLLGGNQGDVKQIFQLVMKELEDNLGVISQFSPVYQTEPWGFQSEDPFLNQVVCVQTKFAPETVLSRILNIEEKFGRQRNGTGYSSRPIDIDILFYNDRVINTNTLTVPHPRLHLRKFTLKPLNDISPDWIHPVLGKTISELLVLCEDTLLAEPLAG